MEGFFILEEYKDTALRISEDLEMLRRIDVGILAVQLLEGKEGSEIAHDATVEELEWLITDGNEAGQEMFYKYYRLVGYFANKLANGLVCATIDSDDIRQIGWEHFLTTTNNYTKKSETSYRLSGYLGAFAERTMRSVVQKEKYAVRLPDTMQKTVETLLAINLRRMQERRPIMSDEEIAERFGVQVGPMSLKDEPGLRTTGDVHESIRLTRLMGSTDSGYNPNADFSLGDGYEMDEINHLISILSPPDKSSVELVEFEQMSEQIREVLDTLSEREAGVVSMKFGMLDGRTRSFGEIGKVYGITSDRASQIYNKTMSKLRHPTRRDLLVSYFEDL